MNEEFKKGKYDPSKQKQSSQGGSDSTNQVPTNPEPQSSKPLRYTDEYMAQWEKDIIRIDKLEEQGRLSISERIELRILKARYPIK